MGSDDANLLGGLTALGIALGNVLGALLAFAFSLVGILSALFSALPVIIIALVMTAAMMPWVKYHDRALETLEFSARNTVYPIYRDVIRQILDFLRIIYNPIICWWNAANWWGYGMVREVLWPVARDCGVTQVFVTAVPFIKAVALDIVVFIATGRWQDQYADFSRVTPAGIALFEAWINVYTCACGDLADVVRTLPILNPLIFIPPAWPVMGVLIAFSGEWTDPKTWCAIENLFNTMVALAQQVLKLILQLLYLITNTSLPPDRPFIRPDFREAIIKACAAIECGVRSFENAVQLFWDQYVPFKFVFKEYLCIVDSLACIALKIFGLLWRTLINIDKAVMYPLDPFYETVVKPDMIEIMNLIVAPSRFTTIVVPPLPNPQRFLIRDYYLDTNSQNTPLGAPNPVFGMRRLDQCVCTLIQRTICDPSDTSTACFSQGAQNLLMGLDFCCLTNNLFILIIDIISALYEFTYHLTNGADNFFLYVDNQPFTTVLKEDLVKLVRCVLSIFGLIPVVGPSIRELITSIVRYLLCLVDFFTRFILGLVTLPYFLIVLPTIPNFLTAANEAVDFFVNIHEDLIADTPTSVKNTLCVILNNGFPIPPIPCPTCTVGGYVPPPPFKKRYMYDPQTGETSGPWDWAKEVWGVPPESENDASRHLTPLLKYDNHTTNPIVLYNLIWANVKLMDPKSMSFPDIKSMDEYVDKKHAEIFKRWHQVKSCNKERDEGVQLQRTNPRLYEYNRQRGHYTCNPDESMMPPFEGTFQHYSSSPNRRRNMTSFIQDMEARDEEIMLMGGGLNSSYASTLPPGEDHQQAERLTLGPTLPPLAGCSPSPPCFDLCCIVRATLVFLVRVIELLARFFNGLIQGSASLQGTVQDYPYFTGELANLGKATFESDFIAAILALFVPIRCACQVLNLVIPVVPLDPSNPSMLAGRPDLCCFVQRISELIACIIQVLLNSINGLALGASTGFSYFTKGLFKNDVNILFDITLEVVVCLCIFVRAVFPLEYIPGFKAATNFDICCAPQAILVTVIEIARAILQIIISLATISVDASSFCYWRLDYTWDGVSGHKCGGSLDRIGLIVQLDVIINSFLPSHEVNNGGECMKTCGYENGDNGIAPCLCQILNTLIPWRQNPALAANCSPDPAKKNCQRIDVCCPIVKIGYFLSDSLKMLTRLLVSLWQPWTGGLPEFFIHYVWCAEGYPVPCAELQYVEPKACSKLINKQIPGCVGTFPVLGPSNTIEYRCGEYTCGKVNIILADITDPFVGLLARCTCVIFSLLDQLLAFIFNLLGIIGIGSGWSCCFCGGFSGTSGNYQCNVLDTDICKAGLQGRGSGFLPAVSYILQAILVAVTDLVRQFPLSCYWRPYSSTDAGGEVTPTIIEHTWIFSFLGPTSNALCIAVGNLACFAQSLFFLPSACMPRAQKTLGSGVRWIFEVVFRVIGFIEAFILQYVNKDQTDGADMSTCVGPMCDQKAGSKPQEASIGGGEGGEASVEAKPLGNMLNILLSIPIDLLIGDSGIACTTICPRRTAVPSPTPCGCWNAARFYGKNGDPPLGQYEFINTTLGGLGPSDACRDPDNTTAVIHVGLKFGDTTGCCRVRFVSLESPKSPMPICINPDDYRLLNRPGVFYPGPCGYLSACRPDALPSCANDPMTPYGLSANYVGAVDGIVIGLVRYLMCLLNQMLPPNCETGAGTPSCTKLGLIFYPALLIFSISWQILGGFIRFNTAILIFLFSLFNPPTADACTCWEHTEPDGFKRTGVRYYKQVGGLCYSCRTLRFKCAVPHNYAQHSNQECSIFTNPCRDYCPYNQKERNPTINASYALQLCMQDILQADLDNPLIDPYQACTGHFPNRTAYGAVNPNCTFQLKAVTTTTRTSGLCLPRNASWKDADQCTGILALLDPDCGGSYPAGLKALPCGDPYHAYMQLDACPDPNCQVGAPTQTVGEACPGGGKGIWPCGGGHLDILTVVFHGPFADNYNADPLPVCSGLQIISNFLDIFSAFVAIFTTPLILPDASGLKRGEPSNKHTFNVREPRQVFNKRFDGTVYGLTADGPNFIETTTAAIYGYDTSDCYDDPVTCACRNLDIKSHCYVDPETGRLVFGPLGRKRDGTNMTANDMTSMLAQEVFTGASVCDHIIGHCNGMDWDSQINHEAKSQWVKCFDKHVQGSRLKQVADVVPEDIMYNSQSPLQLVHNIFHTTREGLSNRFAQRVARASRKPEKTPRQEFEEKFPRLGERLYNRSIVVQDILRTKYDIQPYDLMYDAIVKADAIWYKWQIGMYSYAASKTADAIMKGERIFPTTQEALKDVKYAVEDFRRIITNQPYSEVVTASSDAVKIASRFVGEIVDEGVIQYMKRVYGDFSKRKLAEREPHQKRKEEQFFQEAQEWPIVKWWTDKTRSEKPSIFAPFMNHLSNVVGFQREHWQNQTFSFWNADLKFWSASEILLSRWKNPVYTPEQEQNWFKLKRLYYRLYDKIWPGVLPHEIRERFMFFSNCIVLEKSLDITVTVVDYCANNALRNVRHLIGDDRDHPIARNNYFTTTSPYRNDTYYGWQNRGKFEEVQTVPGDPNSWYRPRIILPNATTPNSHKVDYRVYRRAVTMNNRGPAGFNLFDWLTILVEDLTGFAVGAKADTWFDEIRAWISNPNTDIAQFPDVGLMYWIRFPFVCKFPGSFNCSIGAGLETSLLWVTVGFLALFLASAYISPLITLPFQIIGFGIGYWIVFAAVAWHFPPACMIMSPSFPLGAGIGLPECVLDQLVAFTDKWVSNCYSPLVIPTYMISGPLCPTDPTQYIDVLNCRDVGVSDGLQNILYLGFWLFGSTFCDIAIQFTSITLGNFFPGVEDYMLTTLNDFKNANPTHMQRLTFCFYATLPTLLFPVAVLFVGGLMLALIATPLFLLISSFVNAFMASPAAVVVPGSNSEVWYGSDVSREEGRFPSQPREEQEQQQQQQSVSVGQRIRNVIFGPGAARGKKTIKVE